MELRPARPDDLPAIRTLIADSARGLSSGHYTPRQIESLIRHVFGPDSQLIADGTYYLCEEAGELAAAGGWSGRSTPLDPATEPARIRAFFVHPRWARRGLGRRLFERCREDAVAAGFGEFTLVASLPGEPLYTALGFEVTRRFQLEMPDGVSVEASEMRHRSIVGQSTLTTSPQPRRSDSFSAVRRAASAPIT